MITFLGDIALLNGEISGSYTPDGEYIFNLEYVIKNKSLAPKINKINLGSDACNFEDIFGKQPRAVCIANNHTMDFGLTGYDSTGGFLKEKQIGIIGGDTVWLTPTTCVLGYCDLKFGGTEDELFAFSKEKALRDIDTAKKGGAKCIIANMHWGIEFSPKQSQKQVETAHWLIDNGVTLVIGHHSHCIQPVEIYKGKYIFYSLGNCVFPNIDTPSHYTKDGMAKRFYRMHFPKWGRESLAVVWNEESETLERVDLLRFEKNKLRCAKRDIPLKKYLKAFNSSLAKYVYVFRKYSLFLCSNSFVDGKLFDLDAVKHEMRKK